MHRRLPSLNALRVFEAAARRESFKDAAEELHVTHAAVSHQVKALEQSLGLQLFRRRGRGVTVTDAARRYAQEIGKALDCVQAATTELSGNPMSGILRVSIAPFYGNRIVLPRLSRFHALYPEIKVEPNMSSAVLDFRKSELDGGLRYGRGLWPGLTAIEIHRDELVPVAAPAVVEGKTLPLSPAEIARMTLGYIEGDEGDWAAWLRKAGHDGDPPSNMLGYGNRARVIDLAFSGHGLALADVRLTAPDVAAGHLVRLNDTRISTGRAMWLVYPETEFPDKRLLAFGAWFKSEIDAIPAL